MDVVLVTAVENLVLLKEMGLIKLTISYDTVYDKRETRSEKSTITLNKYYIINQGLSYYICDVQPNTKTKLN